MAAVPVIVSDTWANDALGALLRAWPMRLAVLTDDDVRQDFEISASTERASFELDALILAEVERIHCLDPRSHSSDTSR